MKALALNRAALVLSFAGIYVSGILSIAAKFDANVPCGASQGCETVARHPSSHILGFPNAYLGLLAYAILAVLSYWRILNPAARRTLVVGYALTALGTLASLALTYISLTQIHATCLWCLASAGIMCLLLIVHSVLMQTEGRPDTQFQMLDGIVLAALILVSLIGFGVQGSIMVANAHHTISSDRLAELPPETILPPDAHSYGDPAAPITIVEFGDLLCPTCQQEYPRVQRYVGLHREVRYVFRHFPLYKLPGHEMSTAAAVAAEVAADKGQFWNFLTNIYSKEHDELKSSDAILSVAQSVGLDPNTTLKRIQDGEDPAFKRMMRDLNDGNKIGVSVTPTFIIVAPGVPTRAVPPDLLVSEIEGDSYKKFFNGGKK